MKKAFTIVELLTVMSIIIVLIGLLVPALRKARTFALIVEQRSQFHSIEAGLEMFYLDYGDYPPNHRDAFTLTESLVGQDLLGFHPDSVFKINLMNKTETAYLYLVPGNSQSEQDVDAENLRSRKLYLSVDDNQVSKFKDIYASAEEAEGLTPDIQEVYLVCDVFRKKMNTGNKTGMPLVYWKAHKGASNPHYENSVWYEPNEPKYYSIGDNVLPTHLPVPFDGVFHPMGIDVRIFYDAINDYDCPLESGRPYNQDSYILLSAGPDGLYGTGDDIYNF